MRHTRGWFTTLLLVAASVACGEKPADDFTSRGGGTSTGGTGGVAAGSGGTDAGANATGGSTAGGNAGSSSGTPGTGGTPGGSGPGGAAGSGDAGGSGATGTGGAGGAAGTGGGMPVTCTITPTSSVSTAIPTVGVVTFTTDLAGITDARIEFGLTTAYGMTAPVNLAQPSYRTLLIGMKPSQMYHYRVVARAGQSECTGADGTIATGALSGTLPAITRTPSDASGAAAGFLIGSLTQGGGLFILDPDGVVVWAYAATGVSRAQLSADSQYMWLLSTNQAGGNPNVRRIAMDGTGGLEMHTEFGDAHHDLVVLPDDSVGFFQYMGMRDRLMERAPSGMVRQIVDVPTAHGGVTNNHANSIQYFAADDSYTFSDLDQNCYVKVSRAGQVAWVLGGNTSDFTGAGATWTREHGHHLLAPNRILFFNNGPNGSDAVAREVSLDLVAMTATTAWSYNGMETSNTLGDVQRLWNGNTFITYSNPGIVHEVNGSGTLVQSTSLEDGGFGYLTKRPTLYGAAPKYSAP